MLCGVSTRTKLTRLEKQCLFPWDSTLSLCPSKDRFNHLQIYSVLHFLPSHMLVENDNETTLRSGELILISYVSAMKVLHIVPN